MYHDTGVLLYVVEENTSFTLFDGAVVNVPSGSFILTINGYDSSDLLVYFDCVEVSFTDNVFAYSKTILGAQFKIDIDLTSTIFSFVASSELPSSKFFIDKTAMGELPSSPTVDNGGGFSVPSLNGNCASLPDGTTVTVNGLAGDFVVEGSQFSWNDATDKQSTIIYKLSKDGSFCLVPDAYITAKAS